MIKMRLQGSRNDIRWFLKILEKDRMVHTLGIDADGDYIPCSVKKTLYAAQCWDAWKQVKYNGKSKAESVVRLYWNC